VRERDGRAWKPRPQTQLAEDDTRGTRQVWLGHGRTLSAMLFVRVTHERIARASGHMSSGRRWTALRGALLGDRAVLSEASSRSGREMLSEAELRLGVTVRASLDRPMQVG
jgi:hypothetical protein